MHFTLMADPKEVTINEDTIMSQDHLPHNNPSSLSNNTPGPPSGPTWLNLYNPRSTLLKKRWPLS